ncbi:MAG: bifunctional adenosylcobinamide kinase/adenosylcobinamide-phosphate guanylyltransferase [Spirochaeta sp. LUC14_002_19_P3]|nr:MAG: bifunctional adenosylcobinamide kinase/adenosylcobinamide-phosphate guanylyltransferase [Spirochaeta sp. LUC14_002_19_P3]
MVFMILILGGIKSGKSSFAARLAEQRGMPVVYLATGFAGDEEMADRIARHRAERPASWQTVEEMLNPAAVLANLPGQRTILLDCITAWLTNIIAPLGEEPLRKEVILTINNEIDRLIFAVQDWEQDGGECVLVSNQVEAGLVSPWPLGRVFQDAAGLAHQSLAEAAHTVYLMTAGIPLRLKQALPHEE